MKNDRIPFDEALQIAKQIAEALEAAHERVWFVLRYIRRKMTQFAYPTLHVWARDAWILEPWLTALLVLGVAIVLRAVRWRLLISREHRPSTADVTRALLVGYLFNSILPARAGEAVRVVFLRQRTGTPKFVALGTVIAERTCDRLRLSCARLA